jgi:solute carrier family 25 (mitochondrial citrate transporter), member 1
MHVFMYATCTRALLFTSLLTKMAPQKSQKNPLTPLAAGCIAGGVEATCVWPMEYIKTQLQLHKGSQLPYTGVFSGLRYTVRTTGFISLYRGLAPTLLGSIPKAGIRFGLNSVIKEKLRDKDGKLTPAKNFVAGLGAGVMEAIIIVAPVETVKTKTIELNMAFIPGMKHIIKTEGVQGLYQGALATALKQGSNQGLRFMWFNEYKRIVTHDGETTLSPIQSLLGGMSAGCFSTLGNNPFDVVKVIACVMRVSLVGRCDNFSHA